MGTARRCGESYGELFAARLAGFYQQEIAATSRSLAYAKACSLAIEKYAPDAASFLQGMARGAKVLSLVELTLLTLHEELEHQSHCTALVATKRATTTARTIVAQNWDWKPARFPWPGLLSLKVRGAPALLAYHYPGLWTSLGINAKGLTLMWTGGGYYPPVAPVVGVPTYVVIAELLRLKSVEEALARLTKVKHAGSFLFFLADATGAAAIVEGIPGRLAVERVATYQCRANHFEDPALVKATLQVLPPKKISNTRIRRRQIGEALALRADDLSPEAARAILTKPPELYRFGAQSMTIDSFVAVCEDRTLSVARGGPRPGAWHTYAV